MSRHSFVDTVREGDGSSMTAGSSLPAGVSRASALKQLLDKHEEPDPTRDVPAHRFWARYGRRIVKTAMFGGFAIALFASSARADDRAERAAAIMRNLDSTANYDKHPACTDCDGPRVFVINSTPGASSWMTFPPESPRRRLDGTLLTDPPTVYGGYNAWFHPWPVAVGGADHRGGYDRAQHLPARAGTRSPSGVR